MEEIRAFFLDVVNDTNETLYIENSESAFKRKLESEDLFFRVCDFKDKKYLVAYSEKAREKGIPSVMSSLRFTAITCGNVLIFNYDENNRPDSLTREDVAILRNRLVRLSALTKAEPYNMLAAIG